MQPLSLAAPAAGMLFFLSPSYTPPPSLLFPYDFSISCWCYHIPSCLLLILIFCNAAQKWPNMWASFSPPSTICLFHPDSSPLIALLFAWAGSFSRTDMWSSTPR